MPCALKATHYQEHVCVKAKGFPRRNISNLSQNCSQIFFSLRDFCNRFCWKVLNLFRFYVMVMPCFDVLQTKSALPNQYRTAM